MADKFLCSIPSCGKPADKRGWCGAHYRRWQRHGSVDAKRGLRVPPGSRLAWLEEHCNFSGDECLTWPFAYEANGYGSMVYDDRHTSANRVMCILSKGPPPTPEHEAAHSCGKGDSGCLNPEHLYWRTAEQNQGDRVSHGTHNRGSRSPSVKLTEDQVRMIRAMEGFESNPKTAARFGVSKVAVRKIQKRENWAWLE